MWRKRNPANRRARRYGSSQPLVRRAAWASVAGGSSLGWGFLPKPARSFAAFCTVHDRSYMERRSPLRLLGAPAPRCHSEPSEARDPSCAEALPRSLRRPRLNCAYFRISAFQFEFRLSNFQQGAPQPRGNLAPSPGIENHRRCRGGLQAVPFLACGRHRFRRWRGLSVAGPPVAGLDSCLSPAVLCAVSIPDGFARSKATRCSAPSSAPLA